MSTWHTLTPGMSPALLNTWSSTNDPSSVFPCDMNARKTSGRFLSVMIDSGSYGSSSISLQRSINYPIVHFEMSNFREENISIMPDLTNNIYIDQSTEY